VGHLAVLLGVLEVVHADLPEVGNLRLHNLAPFHPLLDLLLFGWIDFGGKILSESGEEVLLPGDSFFYLSLLLF
jgi:hypothetical protein